GGEGGPGGGGVAPRGLPRQPDAAWGPTPSESPPPPPAPAAPDAAPPHEDFWDRISEELSADTERDEGTPLWPVTGPSAMGGERGDVPAEGPADQIAEAGSGTGHPRDPGSGRFATP